MAFIKFPLALSLALAAIPSFGETGLQPHTGWKLVPGAENLLTSGYWVWTDWGVSEMLSQTSAGVLNASAPNGYLGEVNLLAPYLNTKGDFGIIAQLQTGKDMSGLVTLTGSMNTGAMSWQGMTEVEYGFDGSGNLVFAYLQLEHR